MPRVLKGLEISDRRSLAVSCLKTVRAGCLRGSLFCPDASRNQPDLPWRLNQEAHALRSPIQGRGRQAASWSASNLHPHLPWSTSDFWRHNPAVLANDGDQQRSGRQPTFTVEEDEFIRKQTLAIPGAGVDIPIALRLAQQRGQDPSVAPEAKARYENFKGSPHWLADYLTKMQLSEHIPHPVSMKTFRAGSSGQGQGITSGTRVLFVRV